MSRSYGLTTKCEYHISGYLYSHCNKYTNAQTTSQEAAIDLEEN